MNFKFIKFSAKMQNIIISSLSRPKMEEELSNMRILTGFTLSNDAIFKYNQLKRKENKNKLQSNPFVIKKKIFFHQT